MAVADVIASVVLARFDSLPSKCKPLTDNDDSRGWTVLCGIVAKKGMNTACLRTLLLFNKQTLTSYYM